jgi:RNA polymerase-binding transcription factor DksA
MPARKSPTSATPATPARAKGSAAKPATAKPAAAKPVTARPAAAKSTTARPAATATKAAAAKATPAKAAPRAPAAPEQVMPADHKHFEGRLLEERARLLKELGYLEVNVLNKNPRDSSGDLSGYSFHMADAGTDAMEREKAFLFASAEGRALYDVDEALRRLYKGEYGMCDSCHKPIAPQRLEVVPHARLCITCKQKEEKAGRR